MPDEWWTDDTLLLTRLDEAVHAGQVVPTTFVDAGRAVFQPSDVDTELAQLVYDSQHDLVGTRTEDAPVRALTFASANHSIELEITGAAVLGQLVPPHATQVEVEFQNGPSITSDSDRLGVFTIEPVPVGQFRLRHQTPSGPIVVTGWIAI